MGWWLILEMILSTVGRRDRCKAIMLPRICTKQRSFVQLTLRAYAVGLEVSEIVLFCQQIVPTDSIFKHIECQKEWMDTFINESEVMPTLSKYTRSLEIITLLKKLGGTHV